MFRATSWPLGELLRALKVSRRLTGSRDEPGMFVLRRDEAHRLVGCMVGQKQHGVESVVDAMRQR
jgi:hypothetical protein